jgi:Family of unknown function (DUF5696)
MSFRNISLALIVAAAVVCPAAAQAPGAGVSRVARQSAVEDWVLANSHLRAVLRADSLTLSVEDLSAHETWSSDLWENSAGRIHLRGKSGEALSVGLGAAAQKNIEAVAGTGVRISLSGFRSRLGPVREDRGVESSLSATLEIDLAQGSPELTFRVLELRNTSPYWTLESIEWPMRLFPVRTLDDDGYIVFPQEQGFIVPSRFDQGYFRYLNWIWERIAGSAFVSDSISMPWYGAKKGQSSFLAIIETPDDVAYGVIANDVRAPGQPPAPPSAVPGPNTALMSPRLSAIWPLWRSTKGDLGYPRIARYIFQPHGGYVEMCKTYRKYAQQLGKLVTLKQKMTANPEVAKLIGAPNFEIHVVANRARQPQYLTLSGPITDGAHQLQTSFEQIEAMVKDMHDNLHLDRALIRIAGWGGRGYDNDRPIDAAVVNEEAGGTARLARAIAAAKQAGYLGGLWDDYREMEVNAPSYDEKYIVREASGARFVGFTSDGGHSEDVCAREAVKMFRKNMEGYQRDLKPNLIYLDTIGGLALTECYDPRHPMTRTDNREARIDIMRVVTDQKMVLGAEGTPTDWSLALASFYDEHPIRIGIEVPLYSLVYHDCAMLYRQHSNPFNYGLDNYGFVRGGAWPGKFLRALLYGDQSSWTFSNRAYYAWRDTLKKINDILEPHQKRLAHEEMLNHEILTPDLLVQRTTFSSGIQVTVNYGEFPFKLEDGSELPAYGYRVKDASPTGHSFSGQVEVGIVPAAR